MDLGIRNKNVIIAGGSRGIGRSIAECFSEEGANIAICGRSEISIEETLRLLGKKSKTMGKSLNIEDKNKFQGWIKEIEQEWGGIDIFIWNISAQSKEWSESFNVDILSCINSIEYILPLLEKSPSPSIVSIGSQTSSLSKPRYKAYPAMKVTLLHYMSSLSKELISKGIRVNTVSPSEVEYPGGIWDRIRTETPKKYEQAIQRSPLRRFAKPEEVARTVVFIASPAASFISGANILVDASSRDHVQF